MKGPFWVIASEDRIIAVPVDLHVLPVPSHKKCWPNVGGSSKPWYFFPRGRVEIRRGKALIFANSRCFEYEKLAEELRKTFKLGDMELEFKADNSAHYTQGVFGESRDHSLQK